MTAGFTHVRLGRYESNTSSAIFDRGKNLERIESGLRVPAGVGMPAASGDCDSVALCTRVAKHGKCETSCRRLHGDKVAVCQSHSLRSQRIHLGDGLPADFGDRIGDLLEPRIVRSPAITEQRVRVDNEVHVAAGLIDRRSDAHWWDGARRS